MKTKEVNIILAYPGTCVDIRPTGTDFVVCEKFDVDSDVRDMDETTKALHTMETLRDLISKTTENIMCIIPWSKEMEYQLVNAKMNFTTILPKTHKAQEWFMRLVDLGYGFNAAAAVVQRWKDLEDYKAAYPYETVYHLATDMELDFKDLRELVKHGRIRVLEFKIFLADMIPYPEIFAFWLVWSLCMFIGLRDKMQWLLMCVQTFVYTAGLNYVFKSTIMRRREKRRNRRY